MKTKTKLIIIFSILIVAVASFFIHYNLKVSKLKKDIEEYEKPFIEDGYELSETKYTKVIFHKDNIILNYGTIFILNEGLDIEDYLKLSATDYDDLQSNEYKQFSKVVQYVFYNSSDFNMAMVYDETKRCVSSTEHNSICMFVDPNIEKSNDSIEGNKLTKEALEQFELLSDTTRSYSSFESLSHNINKQNYYFAKDDVTFWVLNKAVPNIF